MSVNTTLGAIALTAFVATATPYAAMAQNTSVTNIDEDFSLFTSGSEESPSEAINSDDGSIPARYFQQSGWSGYGVHQAGGACALINPDSYGAQLNTAVGRYSGTYIVKVRAKTLAANYQNNARLSIGLWEEAENQYNQTSYYENFVTSKDDWREFTYTFNNTDYANSDRMLVAFYTNDKVLIDDVHIYKSDELAAPTVYGATDFTADGFTAHWAPMDNATHYLFSLFHNEKNPVSHTYDYSESFESLKNGSLPDGWSYTSTSGNQPELYTNTDGKVPSAIMFKNGDVITMPDNDGTFTSLSFSLIECKMPRNAEDLWGTEIFVDLWNGINWTNFTTIQVDADEYGDQLIHEIDWSRFIKQDKYKCTSVRFRITGLQDDCAFGLTDFKWSTQSTSTTTYDIRDQRVNDTQYTVSQLDPNTDYFYTVKACNDESTSPSSNAVEADGLATPVAYEATDVNHDSYTAHWQPVAKATGYEVNNYDVFVAPDDVNNYVVLNEDFSKIADTGVSIDRPFAFQNSNYQKLGDNMVYRQGWQCLWGGYADGCFVGTGMTDYNISGELLTPSLTLSNDNGRYHVRITARSMLKEDVLYVYSQASDNAMQCNLSPDEWRTFDADITGGQLNDIVTITSAYHYPFIIDDIKITQNLKAGDKVFELLSTSGIVDAEEEEYTVSNLKQPSVNHTYAYTVNAVRQRQSSTTRSKESEYQTVDGFLGITDTRSGGSLTETGRYTTDGMKAGKNARGVIVIRYADGSAKKTVVE